MAFVVRRLRIELILLISTYAELLIRSICFTVDRVASMQTARFLPWPLKGMSRLPALKWLSCDTLTVLQDPTKRASALSLSNFSLLPVIHLPTESTHCSTSAISEWKSEGAELDWWSWVSSANLWQPHLLREMTSDSGWMYRVKSTGPKRMSTYCDVHGKQTGSYHRYTHALARTYARTHARTHAHTHTHTEKCNKK